MASTGVGATHASPLPGQDGITQRKFLARLQGEVFKRGTIDVLRNGLKHGPHHLDLFYGTPSPGNEGPRSASSTTDSPYGENRCPNKMLECVRDTSRNPPFI